jgi:23S rRNA (cytosine1962-C5)-methyltransferase
VNVAIFERSDAEFRIMEGLESRVGMLVGAEATQRLRIQENGLFFEVDIHHGHKTGFYLDQRKNRARLKELVSGRIVLDCFAYSGGFSVSALAGNAEKVIAIDSSEEARGLAQRNIALNGLPMERVEWITGDVFRVLREFRDRGRSFDLVILDPPKFASSLHMCNKQQGVQRYQLTTSSY